MKKVLVKNAGVFAFSLAIIICVFFFVHILSLGAEYSAGVNNQAMRRAEFLMEKQSLDIDNTFKEIGDSAEFYAGKLSESETKDDFDVNVGTIRTFLSTSAKLADIFYYKDGVVTSVLSGGTEDLPELNAFCNSDKPSFS